MAAPVRTDHVAFVRAIWREYARGGAVAVARLVGPDVEWMPLMSERPVTNDDLLGEWGRRYAETTTATVHGFEAHGDCVLAHGSLRTFRASGFVDVQPSWVYCFRDGRLVSAAGYATREEALRAIAAFEAGD